MRCCGAVLPCGGGGPGRAVIPPGAGATRGMPDADRARVVVDVADSAVRPRVRGGTSLSVASMRAAGERRVASGDHRDNDP